MNRKGFIEAVLLPVLAPFLAVALVTVLFCAASKQHAKQRIAKQATAEGRLEYPMKAK